MNKFIIDVTAVNIDTIHLIIDKGPDSGRELHIPPQGAGVGSSPGEEGLLLHDAGLSPVHCRFFFREGDGLWLEAVEGAVVAVNGQAEERTRLYINDHVSAANTMLLVVNDERPVHLIIENGPQKGRHIGVPPGGVELGRVPVDDGVVINDPTVSRSQCRLYFKPGNELWIEDLGAANQTLVNHTPITMRRLNLKDHIQIGSTDLMVVDDGSGGKHARVERIAARVSEDSLPDHFEEAAPDGMINRTDAGTIRIKSGTITNTVRRKRTDWPGLVIKIILLLALAYAGLQGYKFLKSTGAAGGEPQPEIVLPDLSDIYE